MERQLGELEGSTASYYFRYLFVIDLYSGILIPVLVNIPKNTGKLHMYRVYQLFARNTFAEVAHPTKLSGVRGVCNKNGKVAEGSTRYTPEVVSSLRVHMCTRSPVATDKGIAEAIHKLSIVAPCAYLLPTH